MVIAALVAGAAQSAGVEPETLSLSGNEAAALALRENRDILIGEEDIKKAKSVLAQARGGRMPSLNTLFNWSRTSALYMKDISAASTQTTLSQPLYKGGRIVNTIRQSQQAIAVVEASLDAIRAETLYQTLKALYTLKLSGELAKLHLLEAENSRAHLAARTARYQAGEVSESEILAAGAGLRTAEHNAAASRNQREAAQALLAALLHIEQGVRLDADVDFIYDRRQYAYDEAFLQAMKQRPELRRADAQIAYSRTKTEIVRAETRPSVHASWDYYSRSRGSLSFSPSKGWQDYSVVGLTFSWPVFDGLQARAKLAQALVDVRQAELIKDKTAHNIAREVKEAWLAFDSAVAGIAAAESDCRVYEDNAAAAAKKYVAGIISALDRDDARFKYDIALFNRAQAVCDYIIAKMAMDKATGGVFDVETKKL